MTLPMPRLRPSSCATYATTMTIPNRLTGAVALAFIGIVILCRLPASEIAWHAAAGLLVLTITFAMFADPDGNAIGLVKSASA